MTSVVLIDKYGKCTKKNVKNFDESKIYKFVNLKKESKYFGKMHTWNTDDGYISIYCKTKGNAGTENKYELPRPLDEKLFFGKMVLVMHSEENLENENIVDLELENWKNIYNKLMGGEESLNDEEFSSEDEIPEDLKTKNGYMKDGFVVEDDEDIEYDENSEELDDDNLEDDNCDYQDEEEDEDYEEEEEDEDDEEEDDEDYEEDSEESEYEEDDGSELETEEDTDEEEEEEEEDKISENEM